MAGTETALISGAASGIGQGCALELARNHYNLILWDIDADGLQATVAQVQRETPACKVMTAIVDVGDRGAVLKAFEDVPAAGITVTKVAACAGIARLDALSNQRPSDAVRVMAVNYDGAVHVLQAVYLHLIQSKGAAVVIGSTESFVGGGPLHAYAASKHALLGFCRSAAIELGAHGVRINMLSPGTIKTPMYQPELMGPEAMEIDRQLQAKTPLRRLGRPEEIARVIRFLLSDDASYMTGANMVVDGGLTS